MAGSRAFICDIGCTPPRYYESTDMVTWTQCSNAEVHSAYPTGFIGPWVEIGGGVMCVTEKHCWIV